MALLVLRGNYTPAAWRRIKANPDAGPDGLQRCLTLLDGTLVQYFFALDEFDFYGFANLPAAADLVALRHLLFTQADFSRLEAEPLLSPAELLPRLQGLQARLASAAVPGSSR
jgi:hypothetical protein